MSLTKPFFRLGTVLMLLPVTGAAALMISGGSASASTAPAADTSQPGGMVWVLDNVATGMVADDPGFATTPGTEPIQWPATTASPVTTSACPAARLRRTSQLATPPSTPGSGQTPYPVSWDGRSSIPPTRMPGAATSTSSTRAA